MENSVMPSRYHPARSLHCKNAKVIFELFRYVISIFVALHVQHDMTRRRKRGRDSWPMTDRI